MISFIQAVLSLTIGCIFIASAAPKLHHPKGFVLAVLEYRVLPASLGLLFGWALPPLEFLLALMNICGVNVHLANFILSLMLISFIIAIGINIERGRDLDCHCFERTKQHKISLMTLFRDGALLCATVTASIGSNWFGLESWSIFHILGLQETQYFIPILTCIGGTFCAAVLLRVPFFRRGNRNQRSGLAV